LTEGPASGSQWDEGFSFLHTEFQKYGITIVKIEESTGIFLFFGAERQQKCKWMLFVWRDSVWTGCRPSNAIG
jgi:hypothetical protein